MKHIVNQHPHHVFLIQRGEEFHETFKAFCHEQKITAGSFVALGATDEVDLSFYLLEVKKYETTKIQEELEIVNITGNVGTLNGEAIIHAHGTFGKRDFSSVSGHVARMVVSATCEVHLDVYEGRIVRGMDEDTGLTLMQSCDLS